jgi:hypothetical protein
MVVRGAIVIQAQVAQKAAGSCGGATLGYGQYAPSMQRVQGDL